jgi:hypothetical protein
VIESQQIQPTGEQLSIVIGDECVCPAWWNIYVNTVPVYIYNVQPASFFIIKVYFSNLDWVGHEIFFVRLDGF